MKVNVRDEIEFRVSRPGPNTKYPCLVQNSVVIVLATGWNGGDDTFCGVVIKTIGKLFDMGEYSRSWAACEFVVAPKTLIVELSNEA